MVLEHTVLLVEMEPLIVVEVGVAALTMVAAQAQLPQAVRVAQA
jgi:hypothetical protein